MSGGLCRHCGKAMAAGRRWYCSDKCKRQDERAEMKSLRDEIRYKEKPPRFERKRLLTDAEQQRINLTVDERHHVRLESKRYRPGDPEFDAVAAQCTPPHRIKPGSVVDGYERRAFAVPMLGQGRIS